MRNTKIIALSLLLACPTIYSCSDNILSEITTLETSRAFSPSGFEATVFNLSSVRLSWKSVTNAASYRLELFKNGNEDYSGEPMEVAEVGLTELPYTITGLDEGTDYSVRVKALGEGNDDSKWMSIKFKTGVEQMFSPVSLSDILDNAVILRWTKDNTLTKIVLTDKDNNSTDYPLSQTELDAGKIEIDGLTGSTAYTARIYRESKVTGTVTFTTKESLSGDVIDLRNISGDPDALTTALTDPGLQSGTTILLRRGETYNVNNYTINKSIKIMSGAAFEGDRAILNVQKEFNYSGTLDFVKFEDVILKQGGGANYIINASNDNAKITNLSFVNCETAGAFANSFIRLQKTGQEISTLTIDNCIIGDFSVNNTYAIIFANGANSAKIDNISITNSTFYKFSYFIRQDGVIGTSLKISNCTFDNFIRNGYYFVRYSANNPNNPSTFEVKNVIFGKTMESTNAKWIDSANGLPVMEGCYYTSDCVFSGNSITQKKDAGAKEYSGTSTDLFKDPTNANFTIKDADFVGKSTAGDPRWR